MVDLQLDDDLTVRAIDEDGALEIHLTPNEALDMALHMLDCALNILFAEREKR
jgi:hypothetical protein